MEQTQEHMQVWAVFGPLLIDWVVLHYAYGHGFGAYY